MTNNYRKVIFDASALIALITKESGWEKIKPYLTNAVISAVNLSEVYKYCIEFQKLSEEECKDLTKMSTIDIYNFNEEQALIAATLISKTKKLGISFADRACIALSINTGYPVITCDRIWKNLDLDIKIICTR